jgi:hypothetical protein
VVLLEGTLWDDRDAGIGETCGGRGHVADDVEVEREVERYGVERAGLGRGTTTKPAASPNGFGNRQRHLVFFAHEGGEQLGNGNEKKGGFLGEAWIEAHEPVTAGPNVELRAGPQSSRLLVPR